MRIGIVVKDFPPDVIGGMEIQTKRMATELADRGHDVTVFTKRYNHHDDTEVDYNIVRVWNVRFDPFLSTLTFMICCLGILLRRRNDFDVLQCMMLYPVGFLGYVTKNLIGLPYFAWIRGGDYYLMRDIWWKRWMMRQVLNDTLVLAQTPEIREDVLADFNTIRPQIEILGNGVDIPDETASGENILYVGRLAPKKGLEFLFRAMSDIDIDTGPLIVVGDGSERDRLERLSTQLGISVRFEGHIEPESLDSYYRNAGVFVLPSREGEGMPNAILEAMSWGIPVVATESGGIPSIIEKDVTGYVVPMEDPDALADRIATLYSNPEKRQEMGKNAREYVIRNHSWDVLIDGLEEVYSQFETVPESQSPTTEKAN